MTACYICGARATTIDGIVGTDLCDSAQCLDIAWDQAFCHCGEPIAFGFDGDPTHHRGMCDHCDAVRCDAYPGECDR